MRFLTFIAIGLCLCGPATAQTFSVTSPDVQSGVPASSLVLAKHFGLGCDGDNRSPVLNWSGAPDRTQSFVVTVYDKDAPTGLGFMHWVVVNIPATASGLDGGTLPKGAIEARTDMGVPGFVGICPPTGTTHEYVVTVEALDIARLPADANATPALVGFMAHDHILESASLSFRYGR